MMTQTHLLVAAAALTQVGAPKRNAGALAGALVPDAAIYVLFACALIMGIPQETLWNETYWTPGWQSVFAVFNSAPLYLLVLLVGFAFGTNRGWRWAVMAFALAALLHLALDFPFHADDAHIHFWPLTEWRFHSPLSYWDTDHHAVWVRVVECALGLGCAAMVFRRFKAIWARAAVCLAALPYFLVLSFPLMRGV